MNAVNRQRVEDLDPVAVLISVRTALSVGALVAPRLTARLFGVDTDRQPAVPYLARLFGVRDAALALGLARLDEFRDPRRFLELNMVVDLSDAVAGLVAGMRGQLSGRTTAMVTAPAVLNVVLGAAARGRLPAR